MSRTLELDEAGGAIVDSTVERLLGALDGAERRLLQSLLDRVLEE